MQNNIKEKLYAGEKLTEKELSMFGWGEVSGMTEIEVSEGDRGRWTQGMFTVLQNTDNSDYWAMGWEQGLTEYQENEYFEQPYRVKKEEKVVTVTEVSWIEV